MIPSKIGDRNGALAPGAIAAVPRAHRRPLSPRMPARSSRQGNLQEKANCQYCHKWDASGDTATRIALSLRKHASTRAAYRSHKVWPAPPACPITTVLLIRQALLRLDESGPRQERAADGEFLSSAVDAVVKYCCQVVGRGESPTRTASISGQGDAQCEPMKK